MWPGVPLRWEEGPTHSKSLSSAFCRLPQEAEEVVEILEGDQVGEGGKARRGVPELSLLPWDSDWDLQGASLPRPPVGLPHSFPHTPIHPCYYSSIIALFFSKGFSIYHFT